MERRIFHGNLKPNDIAHALLAEFNRGNLIAQVVGNKDHMAVQIATRMGAPSGGATALTINLQTVEDGILVELGQQAWLGVAASLGQTALSALRNPFSLLGRLDDLAQDIENLQLNDKTWQVIEAAVATLGASYALSEKLARIACEYCGSANPLGEGNCLACGAPLGDAQPTTCQNCGFVVTTRETVCPNCNAKLHYGLSH
jgi:DNA-directed RNA polymerase subunit RPC12/RpoP